MFALSSLRGVKQTLRGKATIDATDPERQKSMSAHIPETVVPDVTRTSEPLVSEHRYVDRILL
jgi:hypothetical protein